METRNTHIFLFSSRKPSVHHDEVVQFVVVVAERMELCSYCCALEHNLVGVFGRAGHVFSDGGLRGGRGRFRGSMFRGDGLAAAAAGFVTAGLAVVGLEGNERGTRRKGVLDFLTLLRGHVK